jgi:lysyl endopeptidase
MVRLLAFAGLLLLAGGAQAAVIQAEPELQPRRAAASQPSARANPALAFSVALDPPTPAEIEAGLARTEKMGTALQVGFGREVAALRSELQLRNALRWETLDDGRRVASISVTSSGASALRVGLVTVDLPPDAVVRFHGGPRVSEVRGREILAAIARNIAVDGVSLDARTYWGPVIEGPTAVVEFELGGRDTAEALRVALPSVSHFVTSARRDFAIAKASAACENDVVCYPTWGVESNAVARMIFCEGPKCYYCTGTLLADLDANSAIPYFLTANHCISTQTVASTLQTDWFYRAAACNSGTAGISQTLTGGATLLHASATTDTSFLKLNDTPPGGAAFAGWTVGATPALGTDIAGIHHPAGDLQKISFGDIDSYWTCAEGHGDRFSCSAASAAAATFYGVVWRSGVTEGGSSGSAIFDDAGQHVVGQLYGGSSSCTTPTARDYYGRFDVAYNAALKKWLSPPTLLSIASRKYHSGVGSVFDLPIDVAIGIGGPVSVEPRFSGSPGHSLVFTFGTTITNPGTVSCSDASGLPIGSPSLLWGANEVTVALDGVPATGRVKVTLDGVNGSGASYSAAVGFLVGDVDHTLQVNSLDVDGIRERSGSMVGASNFHYDLNLSGVITAADILIAKGRSLVAL